MIFLYLGWVFPFVLMVPLFGKLATSDVSKKVAVWVILGVTVVAMLVHWVLNAILSFGESFDGGEDEYRIACWLLIDVVLAVGFILGKVRGKGH